ERKTLMRAFVLLVLRPTLCAALLASVTALVAVDEAPALAPSSWGPKDRKTFRFRADAQDGVKIVPLTNSGVGSCPLPDAAPFITPDGNARLVGKAYTTKGRHILRLTFKLLGEAGPLQTVGPFDSPLLMEGQPPQPIDVTRRYTSALYDAIVDVSTTFEC